MKKEFLSNIIFLLLINLLVKPLYIFGIEVHVFNILGPDVVGPYFIILSVSMLLQIIHEPGIQTYNTKVLASAKTEEEKSNHLSAVFSTKLVLGILYFLGVYILCYFRGIHDGSLIFFIASTTFLGALFVLFRSSLSAIGRFHYDTAINSLDKILALVLLSTLLWVLPNFIDFNVHYFVYCQWLANGIAAIVAFWLLIKHRLVPKFSFSWAAMYQVLKGSFPYASLILLIGILTRVDVLLLDMLRDDGKYQAGIYGAGYRFLDAANMLGYLFGSLLLPMYFLQQSKKQPFQELFMFSLRILSVIGLGLGLVIYGFNKEIIASLFNEAYVKETDTLFWVLLSMVPILLSHSFGAMVQVGGNMREMNVIYIIVIAISLITNVLLIPTYGAKGLAIAGLLSQTVLNVLLLVLIYRHKLAFVPKDFVSKLLVLMLLGAVMLVAISKIPVHWLVQVGLFLITYLLLIFGSKVFTVSELMQMVNNKIKE